MDPGEVRSVRLAILARAPIPGRAKTRLIPALGPEGAARLHEWLVERTVEMAARSACQAVTLWCTPDAEHPLFVRLRAQHGTGLRVQPEGDLGVRMHVALQVELQHGPAILIGTDCPGLSIGFISRAAEALRAGNDAVIVPALDGGYALIGLNCSDRRLFEGVPWGTGGVMAETRTRLRALGWRWHELEPLWDVDRPEDLERLSGSPERQWVREPEGAVRAPGTGREHAQPDHSGSSAFPGPRIDRPAGQSHGEPEERGLIRRLLHISGVGIDPASVADPAHAVPCRSSHPGGLR